MLPQLPIIIDIDPLHCDHSRLPLESEVQAGYHDIDREHNVLYTIVARLLSAETANKSPSTICGILSELEACAHDHFTREERLMELTKYPLRDDHTVQHWKFIDHIGMMISMYEHSKTERMLSLQGFIIQWLSKHTKNDDKMFEEFWRLSYSE
ncbi:MAG: hemerythrin family protein [Rhodospirillaceae bacterium]